jgi:hypothetical protein
VVVDLDGLVLALLGGLVVPGVARAFLDQAGRRLVDQQAPGGDQ